MITDIGFLTRAKLLLNMCCAKCGVWVASEKARLVEFNGMPHECRGRPYGKAPDAEEVELDLQ